MGDLGYCFPRYLEIKVCVSRRKGTQVPGQFSLKTTPYNPAWGGGGDDNLITGWPGLRQLENWELINERPGPWQVNNLYERVTIHWVWLAEWWPSICVWWKRTQSLLELFALSKTNFPSLVFKLRFAGTKVTILFGEQWQMAPSLSPHFKTQSHSLQGSTWINFVH